MKKCLLFMTLLIWYAAVFAQSNNVSGKISDITGQGLPGVSVYLKGTTIGTVTDNNGRFTLANLFPENVIIISFIGMKTVEVKVGNQSVINVILREETVGLSEVVTVGYGVQKKESVVGAIAQIKGESLMQSGGVTSVGEALQGKLAGVVTMFTDGKPGEDNMKIFIRGQSSWNNSGSPLVLVDGVERSMNDLDMNEISGISVLKDASATAVYGVKGANGVLLLTTKRGSTGKAKLSISGNLVAKSISKVPEKYDSYDAMMVTNEAIQRELMYKETSWANFTPIEIASKYRNQATQLEREIYPNVDWKDYMFKDIANDFHLNLSVSGGSDFAKYFCNISYQNEGDMTKNFDTGKGYNAKLSYERYNYRSNLDFNLTKTTKFSVNLSGLYSIKNSSPSDDVRLYLSLYNLAPDLFYPRYSDGSYGYTEVNDQGLSNSLYYYTTAGQNTSYNFRINTDFTLEQKLDFITKGLIFNGRFTLDNTMTGTQNISDPDNIIQKRYANDGKDVFYKYPATDNDYSYVIEPWVLGNFDVGGNKTRRLDYQLSLNYQRTFAQKHNTTALLLFKRQQFAAGNMFPIYYEDWVSRVTYNYDHTYFIEANGAYNGSEKFGPNYRFELFPSIALGWMVSNEPFMKGLTWLDKFKIRASAGQVGDDGFAGRWLYLTQWGSSAVRSEINAPGYFGVTTIAAAQSPYNFYLEKVIGNEDVHWETSLKKDLGVEFSVLKGKITADFDYFQENRRDIYITGDGRTIPDWFGTTPPGANLGKVDVKGFELVLGFKHQFNEKLKISSDISLTHSKDKILYKDDPLLRPSYLKQEGYSIDQTRSAIPGSIMQSWDDVYMSTPLSSGDNFKRIGYYDQVDFNGDGNFNGTYDTAPYAYPNRPQNTWSWTLGSEYKGLSLSVQLYGQSNSIRNYTLSTFPLQTHLFYRDHENYWSKSNPTGVYALDPWTLNSAASDPLKNLVDASMVRLKMVELAYRFPSQSCKKMGVDGFRLFVNGNNLFVWTKMADDRDFGSGNRGTYPTLKRFNFGFTVDL
jgi:TonB-linked SusC/RagA family outer membrane protein